MGTLATIPFLSAFESLPDPRRPGRTMAHNLHELLVIALCAAIGGADDWVAVATFGKAKLAWFRRFLPLENGIPSHDTFGRVFARIDPVAFRACFGEWIADICAQLGLPHVAIDGKCLTGSRDAAAGVKALHLVSAWATGAKLSLGQVAVDDKSNEITAIPKLLELIEISGALVSIDAIGCQKEIAAKIRAQKGDYLLAVKDNQPRLAEDLAAVFDRAVETDFADVRWDHVATEERNRGREEMRQCWVITDLDGIRDRDLWKDLASVIVVVSERVVRGKSQTETRFYISSRKGSARQFASWLRGHWGIENGLHWVLDVVFREDASHVRNSGDDDDNQVENIAWLRRMVLSLLKQIKTKVSLRSMRLKAGWDEAFMEEVLLKFQGK